METTFFTLHELSSNQIRVRFASQAIEDVLGYDSEEVVHTSMWDYLHPDEVPLAEDVLEHSLRHDKAATLNYFHIRHKRGHWVRCEAMSTVVYDVLVASVSVYLSGPKSEKRAADAPVVGMLFSSLKHPQSYLLPGWPVSVAHQLPYSPAHEPRAVMILNRFTRSSAILYASNSVSAVLEVTPDQLVCRSFYQCIEESCLHEAVQCIESAKANDSVAYLRFWFRNPLANADDGDLVSDGAMSPRSDYFSCSSDSEDDGDNEEAVAGASDVSSTTTSSPSHSPTVPRSDGSCGRVEVEGVVSCSSDGILVVLRRATAPIPGFIHQSHHPIYVNRGHPSCGPNTTTTPSTTTTTPKPRAGKSPPNMSGVGGPDYETLVGSIRGAALLGMRGQRCTS